MEDILTKSETEHTGSKNSSLLGIVVYHIAVGQLPREKAEDLVKRRREEWLENGLTDRIRQANYEIVLIPSRESDTHIELLKF